MLAWRGLPSKNIALSLSLIHSTVNIKGFFEKKNHKIFTLQPQISSTQTDGVQREVMPESVTNHTRASLLPNCPLDGQENSHSPPPHRHRTYLLLHGLQAIVGTHVNFAQPRLQNSHAIFQILFDISLLFLQAGELEERRKREKKKERKRNTKDKKETSEKNSLWREVPLTRAGSLGTYLGPGWRSALHLKACCVSGEGGEIGGRGRRRRVQRRWREL